MQGANSTANQTARQFNVMAALQTNIHLRNFTIVMAILVGINAVIASIINCLVILTFAKTKNIRSASNIFIVSLAFLDFIVGILMEPVYCLYLIANLTENIRLSPIMLRIYLYLFTPLAATSFLTITAITVDRFLAIKLHLRYLEVVTTQKAIFVTLYIWFSGIFWGTIYGLWKQKFVVRMIDNAWALVALSVDFYLMFRISREIYNQQQSTQSQNIDLPRL